MTVSELEVFAGKVKADQQLRSRIESSKSFSDVVAVAKDAGCRITEAELQHACSAASERVSPEMTDGELEKVTGGIFLLLAWGFMKAGEKIQQGGFMDTQNKL